MKISSFQKVNEKLGDAYFQAADENIRQAADDVSDGKRVVGTRVAIDGTWQKRGYSSLKWSYCCNIK